jgi:polysaccharide biosynthesis transport protein
MMPDKEKRYSLVDLFLIAKQQLLIITLCIALCAVGAITYTAVFLEKQYTATAIMYAAPNKAISPENPQTPLSEMNYLQKIVLSYVEVLKTETFLESVAKQSNLDYSAQQLQKMVSFEVIKQTEYFELTVISNIPENSLIIANTISRLAPTQIGVINFEDTIRVLNPAKLPTEPSGPSVFRNLLVGLAAGLFLGVILALILNRLSKSIKDKHDLAKRYNVPLLGHLIIPKQDVEPCLGENALANGRYKELLTNLLAEKNADTKKILFTCPEPNSAKSTNCYNLGIILARATTAKVLIIDCDYRRPNPQDEEEFNRSAPYLYFKISQGPGLSQLLSNKNIHSRIINKTEIANLDFIYRGNIPSNPADVLGSAAMKELLATLPTHYDYILIDTPELSSNSDALALSRFVDSAILVVMQGITTFQDIRLALSRFTINELKVTGMILDSRGRFR